MPKKFTHEDFLEQVKREHPNLEVLSEYNGNKNYVTVRCKIHDYTFNTKPNWLHHGAGCQKCYDERRGKTLKKSQEQFIKELEEIYAGKGYDFSKVVYDGNKKKVCIICPKHGEFWVTPNKIITRHDCCPKCSAELNGLSKRLTNESFIKKARNVHGDLYDYSLVKYVTTDTPVRIICKKHGVFEQTPEIHLNGCGCQKCNMSHLEKDLMNFLEENGIEYEWQKKFKWLGKKSLDFYIPSKKIAIECQGMQHFISVEHFGDTCGFADRVKSDIAKNVECEEHGIKIIYLVERESVSELKNELFNGIYDKRTILHEEIEKILEIL